MRTRLLDWAQRRALAFAAFGFESVGFPIYGCDLQLIQEIRGMEADALAEAIVNSAEADAPAAAADKEVEA